MSLINRFKVSNSIDITVGELCSGCIELDPNGKAATEMIAIAEELLAMEPDNAHEFN